MPDYTTEQLIGKFERDMQDTENIDKGQIVVWVDRSLAVSAILEKRKNALPAIVQHLIENPPNQGSNLEHAWVVLFDWLSQAYVCKNRPPFEDEDLAKWIAWAKEEIS